MLRALLCLVVSVVAIPSTPSALTRIGLFIGSNEGLPSEAPLRYAARDARSIGGFFHSKGGFPQKDAIVLANPAVSEVREGLLEVTARIRGLKAKGEEVLLLVYYSGHASADALHIRGRPFARGDFLKAIEGAGADLRITILDACESGDFLREKGIRYVEKTHAFKDLRLESTGTIVLAASSRGELAQESEVYGGGVFTHHLLNGLRGLGDYNRDGVVSVVEAYAYARSATRKDNVRGGMPAQSPAFDLDIVGSTDPGLVRLAPMASRIVIPDLKSPVLDIYEAASMRRAARLSLPGKDTVQFQLAPGRYLFSLPDSKEVKYLEEDLHGGHSLVLDPSQFHSKGRNEFFAKGGRPRPLRPNAAHLGSSRHISGEFEAWLMGAAFHRQVSGVRLHLSVGAGRSRAKGETGLAVANTHLRAGPGLLFSLLETHSIRLLLGGEAALHRVLQSVQDGRFGGEAIEGEDGPVPLSREIAANLWEGLVILEADIQLPGPLLLEVRAASGAAWAKQSVSGRRSVCYAGAQGLSVGFLF